MFGASDSAEGEALRHADRLAKYQKVRKLLADHAAFVAGEYQRHMRGKATGRDVSMLVMSARALESDARDTLAGLD
jgi:hypothetical protein